MFNKLGVNNQLPDFGGKFLVRGWTRGQICLKIMNVKPYPNAGFVSVCGVIGFCVLLTTCVGQSEVAPLVNATADFSQPSMDGFPGYLPSFAIDQNKANDLGWGIFPRVGVAHSIVFETVSDLGFQDGTRYNFKIHQLHTNPGHLLGRFKLFVTRDSRTNFADGRSVDGQIGTGWIAMKPLKVESTSGTTLSVLQDDSVLASGNRPAQDVYTITCESGLTGVTGVRLDVLPDPSLPGQGPGRAPNGNFLLSEVEVLVSPIQPEVEIEVSEVRIKWSSEVGRLYQLEVHPGGVTSEWQSVGLPVEGNGGEMTLVDREVSRVATKLYRIVRLP